MTLFIARSRLGKAMRATAQDPEAARLMGINVDTTISLTFLLGGMLAGAAGLIYALYQTTIWFFQGFQAGLIAFTAAVMGGIGNLQGAVLGGLIIGCIQQISDNRIGTGVDAGDRVRLPDPDHGLPAAGPARRGDEGGRMSAAAAAAPAQRSRRAGAAAVGRAGSLAVARRSCSRSCCRSSSTRQRASSTTASLALAYVVMALGLNIVVGFAGLLDLGYVAFFAIGAYTIGWFGSGFFADAEHPHRRRRVRVATLPGIHLNFLLVLVVAAVLCALAGIAHRPADAAPARRLHRDRDARLRRDHRRVIAVNGDDGIFGIGHFNADRRPRRASRRSTRSTCRSSTRSPAEPQTVVLDRARRWCSIVLFVNFRLRDSRLGRAWIALREDEVAAASMGVPLVKTKLLAYAHRRARSAAWRARSWAPTSTRSTPTSSQFSFSIFVLAMVILGGLGSIWGVVLGAIAAVVHQQPA